MCTGGDDERKNLARLIEAFAALPRELTDTYQLVIVCKLSARSEERYLALAERCGVQGRVVLTNFVSQEELLQLYNLAEWVAFPSTYEGFGLPVTEAWACGKPVVTSNNSSLVQIAGDAAVLVDPFSAEDMARGLKEALTESDREALIRRGRERLKQFSWEMVAAATQAALQELPGRSVQPAVRRRIAFFTPLPPLQSGISDYSVDILGELRRYFDIDVFLDEGYRAEDCLSEGIQVFSHREYRARRKLYYDTVYQMGNSVFHVYMWPYVRKYGGTLVLHDNNLHGNVRHVFLTERKDMAGYRSVLGEDYSEAELRSFFGADEQQLPALETEVNGFLTNYADRILVHSRDACEKLLRRDIGRRVRQINHYAKISPAANGQEAKAALGFSQDVLLFASFGFVQATKRAIPILRAFAKLAEEFPQARYVFVGKLGEGTEERFWETAELLGVKEKVTVTGYVDLEAFQQYMAAVDICLNLRWPYNGETSGSFMRLLAMGKCVVVSDLGSFREVPDEACVKLEKAEGREEADEAEEICRAMRRLAGDAALRESYGRAARSFAESTLDIRIIGKKYADFLLDESRPALTEKTMEFLRGQVLEKGYSETQLRALASTLAFSRG